MGNEVASPQFYSLIEACAVLGRQYYEVYNLAAQGRLTRVKQGRRVVIPAADIDGFLADPEHFSARKLGDGNQRISP